MILLDTHIWVNWIINGQSVLPKHIRAAMDFEPDLSISAISCFEVSMLVKQRKLELPFALEEWFTEALGRSGVSSLPVSCEIAQMSVALSNIHKDPADRIIIATAIAYDAKLASVDTIFPDYPELTGLLIAPAKS